MGKWANSVSSPVILLLKFSYFRDREFFSENGARKLKGSRVSRVNEQFPPEIEEKRRALYPVLRQAKKTTNVLA